MNKETAKYIVKYFSSLLTDKEKMAVKHTSSTFKLNAANNTDLTSVTRIYREKGWLTQDQDVLDLLKDGYDNFEIIVAKRILSEQKDKVFLNYCPKCEQLARTPKAKQCRHCGNDWH
ncbi:hypothetical protein [Lewinella cohaerens]|uniref:hypothetical protein n=1 Tax=Lewinella cohaerens TaxID=70995 RepID=UPI00037158D8|nr:hypothetical protein [Lewinella cohaerens]